MSDFIKEDSETYLAMNAPYSLEELNALLVLAKHNQVVYVNKQSHGVGHIFINGKCPKALTSIEITAMTDAQVPVFIEVKLGIMPTNFRLE